MTQKNKSLISRITGDDISNKEILQLLYEAEVDYIILTFSGGNDEGYIDDVIFEFKDNTLNMDRNNNKQKILERINNYTEYSKEEETKFLRLMNNIYDSTLDVYGSFAGEFSVYGQVMINCEDATWEMNANETEYVPVSHSGNF